MNFQTEAAADIARHHTQAVFCNVQDFARQNAAPAVRRLRSGVERVLFFGGAVVADGAARLYRIGADAVVADFQRHHLVRAGKGGIGPRLVAKGDGERDIVGAARPYFQRIGFDRLLGAHQHRQWRVVDGDLFGGIARLLHRLGHDKGDAVTDAAHAVAHQQRPQRAKARRATALVGDVDGGEGADSIGLDIGAGEYAHHAGHGCGHISVDACDVRMCVR